MARDDDDVPTYRRIMADSIAEKVRWRTEYERAKQLAQTDSTARIDGRSATPPNPDPASSAA